MDFEEQPEELNAPPEKVLAGTLITQKPNPLSLSITLLGILIITGVTQFYWMDPWGWSEFMPAVKRKIFEGGEWWRIFSSVLIHADFGHLLSNLYMLGILSYFVYGYFGFKSYPIYTFLGAALVNLISIQSYPVDTRLLGASGLVYLLGGFWLSLYLMIQRQYSITKRLVRVFGMALMVFFPTTFEPTTSYRTHFIGIVVGAVMGFVYFGIYKKEIRSHEYFKWLYL